jgi:hypothetical protein
LDRCQTIEANPMGIQPMSQRRSRIMKGNSSDHVKNSPNTRISNFRIADLNSKSLVNDSSWEVSIDYIRGDTRGGVPYFMSPIIPSQKKMLMPTKDFNINPCDSPGNSHTLNIVPSFRSRSQAGASRSRIGSHNDINIPS